MTQLTNPATHNHPNFDRAQAALDASRQGDYGPTFEALADEIILENGPGAGPWRVARSKEDMGLFVAGGRRTPLRRPGRRARRCDGCAAL